MCASSLFQINFFVELFITRKTFPRYNIINIIISFTENYCWMDICLTHHQRPWQWINIQNGWTLFRSMTIMTIKYVRIVIAYVFNIKSFFCIAITCTGRLNFSFAYFVVSDSLRSRVDTVYLCVHYAVCINRNLRKIQIIFYLANWSNCCWYWSHSHGHWNWKIKLKRKFSVFCHCLTAHVMAITHCWAKLVRDNSLRLRR